MSNIGTLEQEILAGVASAKDEAALEAVRIAALESGKDPGQALAEAAMWLPIAFELGFLRRAD